MSGKKAIAVTFEIDRQGHITGSYPCAQTDEDFELLRRTLRQLFRPSFAGLLRRLFGGQPEKR